ncbi:sporulation protein YqfD [Ureibacillus sp. MALMAid1270]|uniref:sporulation protein YqfD n=1 Tax=Ureibacillus sp. MALMAid1270 TaxID=3411629 RepID=UPI003BA68CD3
MRVDYRPVEIKITKSDKVHPFIQALHSKKVKIKNIAYADQYITFEIARKDVKIVRETRKKYNLKVKIRYLQSTMIFQRELKTYIGLLFLIIIPIVFSQFIWKVEVEAETPEVRVAVEKVMTEKLNLNSPVFKKNLESDFEIRQTIMEDMRELSWVHIFKKGSKITIVPQLAPITDVKEQKPEQLNHLVAAKSGVVTHFVLTSGERRVSPNTTVYQGDTLVSGVITVGDKSVTIGAVGEVFADYWLETEFTIPKKVQYISSTERKWTINFKINDEKESEQSFREVNLPEWLSRFVEIKETQKYITSTQEITEDQIESFILPLLHEKLLKSLPPKTVIKKENILHVTFDGDKVKGKVLFLVNENIAKPYPISQGE